MNGTDILGITMEGLEEGLLVKHIAALDLKDCNSSDIATEVLSDKALKDFDRIPVRENGCIVGVLERRSAVARSSCKEHMKPLDDSLIISAEAPLINLLPLLRGSTYRLVLVGPEIRGIVTRSDIIKLPVRVLAFTLLTHMEMVMVKVIENTCSSEKEWLALLSEGRQKNVIDKFEDYKEENLHIPLLEFTDLCDKRTILRKALKLGREFTEDLRSIEKLRNTLAHGGDYARDSEKLDTFLDRLQLTKKWIDILSADSQLGNGSK